MNSFSSVTLFICILPSLVSGTASSLRAPLNITSPTARRKVSECGQFCRFHLCKFNGHSLRLPDTSFIILNAPNVATAPYICRSQTSIGQITGTLEASVADGDRLVPISNWSPRGLEKPFAPNFLGAGKIPLLPWSGVTRRAVEEDQWSFLHDKCFVLPVTGYQIIRSGTYRVLRNQRLKQSDRSNCVSFRTTAPQIHIQLAWDAPDDFDLSVTEPDGTVINFLKLRSKRGKLNGDNNEGFCDSGIPGGREDIVYFPNKNIKPGIYRVTATHSIKCGSGATKWTLIISKNGIVDKRRTGRARTGNNSRVETTTFKFP